MASPPPVKEFIFRVEVIDNGFLVSGEENRHRRFCSDEEQIIEAIKGRLRFWMKRVGKGRLPGVDP